MKKKIIASLLLSCSICFLGCNNNSSSLSSHSSLSRKEMKEIINNLTLNYQNKDKMRMYTNDLSMEISASYLQTIHTEKYEIKIEDFTSNMEMNNLKLDSMNGIMNIRGNISSLIDVYNRGIKDEEESNHFELSFRSLRHVYRKRKRTSHTREFLFKRRDRNDRCLWKKTHREKYSY